MVTLLKLFAFCHSLKRNFRCRYSLCEIFVAVGQGYEISLKLGRRQVDALFQHAMEVDAESVQITGGGIIIIGYFLFGEEHGEHGPEAGYLGIRYGENGVSYN